VNLNVILSIIFAIIGVLSSTASAVLYYRAKDMIKKVIDEDLENFVTRAQLLQHQIDCRAVNDKEYAPIEIKDNIKELSEKIDKIYELLIKRG